MGTTVPLQIKLITHLMMVSTRNTSSQSAKDAGSARQRRQQTSWHIRSDASQHERGGGAPPHQPTPNRRVSATHQAYAMPTGVTTDAQEHKQGTTLEIHTPTTPTLSEKRCAKCFFPFSSFSFFFKARVHQFRKIAYFSNGNTKRCIRLTSSINQKGDRDMRSHHLKNRKNIED